VFRKVVVANRGEIARRIMRACRHVGAATVAVHSDADASAAHVADADEAVLIGPAPARESYLNIEAIIHAARRTQAEAIHPGYGFLSENWRFADACASADITFIGPPAEAIRRMGDKPEARRLMAAAGVPVLPGSPGPVSDVAEATRLAERVGFPVLLKAAAGGGGIGMAKVGEAGQLAAAFKGAAAIGYVNAGTLEFLLDADGSFYFLEMNTRLQVEHPVTEAVTGLDLVVAQLRVAAGESLPWTQDAIAQRGAAIECRIYAEDPTKNFLPSPGTISRLELPAGEGIRVESGVVAGSAVTVHYDPLLLKLVAGGASRLEAIARMSEALDRCVIEGVKTTIPFLRRVMAHADYRRGAVHTQMVEQGAFNA